MKNTGYMAGQYCPLSIKDIEMIDEASMKILEDVGYLVENDKLLKMLEEAGCIIDWTYKICKVPRDVLIDYIKMAPARIRLCGRIKENDCIIEQGRTFFDGGGGSTAIEDLETGEVRPSNLKDLAQMSKITDALANVHLMDTPCMPNEVPNPELDLNRFFATTYNCSKPLMISMYNDADKMIRMAQMIAGGEKEFRERPFLSMIVCTISPLKLEASFTENIIKYAKAGVPLYLDTCPTAGLNAPMTLAGTLAQVNAEALFNVFLPEVIEPGAKAFYTVVPNTCDMRTSRFLFGAVENALLNAACAQLAQYYNLPLYTTGGLTEAKCSDFQAGVEKALQVAMGSLAGGQILHDTNGMLNSSLLYSPAQLVADDEVNGMVLRLMRGIEVTPETLAVNAIKEVGCGGEFLSNPHTRKYARKENFLPKYAVRNTYEEWELGGKVNMIDNAREKAKEILKKHEPVRLDDQLVKDLEKEFPEIRIKDCLV